MAYAKNLTAGMIENIMKSLKRYRTPLLAVLALGTVTALAQKDVKEVTVHADRPFPESVTSGSDGTLYVGSILKNGVFRVLPGAATAEPWIAVAEKGVVLGVLADEASHTLWVCHDGPIGPKGPEGVAELMAFDLPSGRAKASYPFPGSGGLCNDMVVGANGDVFATDTFGGKIMKLAKGAKALTVWASDPKLMQADGIAFGEGALYVTTFETSTLVRVAVKEDGSAGELHLIETARKIDHPDGLRSAGKNQFWMVEGAGRFDHIVVEGEKAQVHVIKEGLDGPTAVTLVDGTAWVLESKLHFMDSADAQKDPGVFKIYGYKVR